MAANTISTAFIKEYERDVATTYQREGSMLRNTVRRKTGVVGSTADFQLYGTGVATDKARNGDVVPMNPAHAVVTATLVDKYAPIYVDSLDELKTNIDERNQATQAGAWALGRVADAQIVAVLDAGVTGTYDTSTTTGGLTLAKVLQAIDVNVHGQDVPDDGRLTFVIGWAQTAELFQLQAFTGWEYVGAEKPLLRGAGAFRWHNTLFIPFSGLTKSGSVRYTYCFHETAIGHAIGQEIKTEVNYIPEKVSWLINSYMSQGAVMIYAHGCARMQATE